MARLLGIAIKPHGEKEMRELPGALLSCERGVEGDSRGKPGPRQVTLMSHAAWQMACKELAMDLHWSQRRANLLVDNLSLEESVGAVIHIGDATLEVTGETDPCRRMEALYPGLFAALAMEWRGGVTCRVVKGALLTVGETVALSGQP